MSGLLEGRRGLVLGVSGPNSVGYQAALGFRALGAEVTVTHREARRGEVQRLARDFGCGSVELDCRDERAVELAVVQTGQRYERLDFLVHTLVHVPDGVLDKSVTELSAEDFSQVMDVSVRSLLVACRYALPWLRRSAAPRVVTLLSPGGERALGRYHAVGIAKGALAAAVRYLALELGALGVLCNAVNFSIIETDAALRVIGAELTEKTRAAVARRAFTRRATDYADVVNALAYLASPLCTNLTGEALTVDGGFSRGYL
ncbi:MAG TPA: SDR family oxidoreductase [Polyangiaceae bacterium]|jgi:enoyl-[acyl-carrier protein] reductase I|nr:SDR family oxidoreductase [Polyangiaceae bacterium]